MSVFNVYLLVLGGFTLGALMVGMVPEERAVSWRLRSVLMLAGFAIMYGIMQLPDLGG